MLKQHPFTWTCGCGCTNNDSFEPSYTGPFINVTCDVCGAATDISALSPVDQASYYAAVDYYAKSDTLPTVEQASRRIREINDQYDAVFGHRDWANSDLPDIPGGSAALDELIEAQEIVDAHKAGRRVSTELLRAPA